MYVAISLQGVDGMTRKYKTEADSAAKCRIAVIWIDWYPYHLARFNGLQSAANKNEVAGIELVGGMGVHSGLQFREERRAGLRIETLRPDSNWHDTSKLGLSISLIRSLSRLDPEVVLIPGYYTLPAFAAMAWARIKRRTSVLMTETTATDHLRIQWRERLKARLIRSMFDWAVTGGVAHVRYLRQLGFPEDRIAHFYDVVGNERIRQSCEAMRKTSSAKNHSLPENYFLFVGRLAEEKNVKGLLNAWLDYRRQGGTWSLVLAGDGPEANELQRLLAGSPYQDDVRLPGHKSSRELIPYFAFARCFVLPSIREPWGLVVNEAMAASLPLIVSKRCGCAEDLVTNMKNGLLFDPADHEALVECLRSTESLTAKELRTRGSCSASMISTYSPQDFGQEIARIAMWSEAQRGAEPVRRPSRRGASVPASAIKQVATAESGKRIGSR
jgi:1,2-diacylglycerol 3-alpha-glucosyltransferase